MLAAAHPERSATRPEDVSKRPTFELLSFSTWPSQTLDVRCAPVCILQHDPHVCRTTTRLRRLCAIEGHVLFQACPGTSERVILHPRGELTTLPTRLAATAARRGLVY